MGQVAYDGSGNMTSVSGPLGSWSLVYDDESRPTAITYPTGSDSFLWNALGQRMRATLNGAVKRYIYDGDRVLEQTDDAGNVAARYTTESSSFYQPLLHLWIASGGLSRYPLYDAQGTARRLADDSGAKTDYYTHSAFGYEYPPTGATPNPYRFGGEWGYITDTPGSGLLQLGARFYWPEVGRFIQQDPIGDGRNWYAYAEGNPLTRVDPSGLDERESVWHNIGDWATWKCGLKAASDSGFWWASLKQFAISQIPILPENIAENYGVKQVTHGYARVYYHFTDKRFTAWGAESKLVPKLAKKVAPVLTIPLAFYDWMKALEDSSELLYGYW